MGFIPRQEEKIISEIYEPVLNILSDPKWEIVNRDLSDAFKEYTKHEEESYSHCITHAVSSIQAFLQIVVNNKIGSGNIDSLVKEAINKELIPKDPFSIKIFNGIQSILMKYRQEYSDAHPKREYANEKTAKLVLNLVMIFLQHTLQK